MLSRLCGRSGVNLSSRLRSAPVYPGALNTLLDFARRYHQVHQGLISVRENPVELSIPTERFLSELIFLGNLGDIKGETVEADVEFFTSRDLQQRIIPQDRRFQSRCCGCCGESEFHRYDGPDRALAEGPRLNSWTMTPNSKCSNHDGVWQVTARRFVDEGRTHAGC